MAHLGALAFWGRRQRRLRYRIVFEKLRVMREAVCLLIGLGLGVASCGPVVRGSVAFDGRRHSPLVQPHELREVSDLPAGHKRIGTVAASCTLTTGETELRGAWLSDVDCSESRLRRAVRERAAEVGGEFLIDFECRSEPRKSGPKVDRTAILCRTEVARPNKRTLASRPLNASPVPAAPWGEEAPSALEAWRIRVDYTPAPTADRRSPRRMDTVQELPRLPVSHRRLGDVIARCSDGCSERGAYQGLFATAGRMGASDIVDVACVSQGEGWVCTATAAGYRVDPAKDVAAR